MKDISIRLAESLDAVMIKQVALDYFFQLGEDLKVCGRAGARGQEPLSTLFCVKKR